MSAALIEKVTEIVERAGRQDGIEAVEVQWLGSGKNRVLRIFIDKPSGISHQDCEMISRYVGTVLDAEDAVPGGRYTLEVSSPGVERKLTRPRDFERAIGQKVKIVLREPKAGRMFWEGTLTAYSEKDGATVQPASGEPVTFQLGEVNRANLKFDW